MPGSSYPGQSYFGQEYPLLAAGAVNAALNVTEAADTLSASANVIVGLSLTVTEAADTLSATVSDNIGLSAIVAEANDGLNATSAVLIGTTASNAEADTFFASANVGSPEFASQPALDAGGAGSIARKKRRKKKEVQPEPPRRGVYVDLFQKIAREQARLEVAAPPVAVPVAAPVNAPLPSLAALTATETLVDQIKRDAIEDAAAMLLLDFEEDEPITVRPDDEDAAFLLL